MINENINAPANGASYNKIKYIEQLEYKVSGLEEENTHLNELVKTYKKMLFGQSSEKTKYIEGNEQITLFNEAETEADPKVKEPTITVAAHERKAKRTHEELAAYLPIEEVLHTIPEEERVCGKCGDGLVVIGKEKVRDQIVFVPARTYIERIVREVYVCPSCGEQESKDAALSDIEKKNIIKAKVPEAVIEHSIASPSAVAYVMYEKYVNAVPLYRMEKDLERKGLKISRATLANWVIYASGRWLEPLWNELKAELLRSTVIHADETPVQVLHEKGRKATQKSYMWVYCTGEFYKHPAVLYEYSPTRAGENAGKFLAGYHGALVADGYDGYNGVEAVRCGCWAHLRRRFKEAMPGTAEMKGSKAAVGFDFCNHLFALEKEFREKTPEERHKLRQEQSKKVLDAFWLWLDTVHSVGGSKLEKATGYARRENKYLNAFLDNPLIPISNNLCENSIRPFTIGRKNWLFAASPKGAKASAVVYSIIESSKMNDLNPYEYLLYLFREMPRLKTLTPETLHAFMPWSASLPDSCKLHVD